MGNVPCIGADHEDDGTFMTLMSQGLCADLGEEQATRMREKLSSSENWQRDEPVRANGRLALRGKCSCNGPERERDGTL